MNDELQDRLDRVLAFRAVVKAMVSAFSELSLEQIKAFDEATEDKHDPDED